MRTVCEEIENKWLTMNPSSAAKSLKFMESMVMPFAQMPSKFWETAVTCRVATSITSLTAMQLENEQNHLQLNAFRDIVKTSFTHLNIVSGDYHRWVNRDDAPCTYEDFRNTLIKLADQDTTANSRREFQRGATKQVPSQLNRM